MNAHEDPALEALELLRSDERLALPSPDRPLPWATGRGRAARRRRAGLPPLWIALGLGTAAVGAALGARSVRSWWYSITVDGEQRSGTVEGDGERTTRFTTADGCAVTVRVRRRAGDGFEPGIEHGIEVVQEGPGRLLEHDVETVRRDERPRPRLPRSALPAGEPLHAWTGPDGRRWALHLAPDAEGAGSRLLLDETDADPEASVTLVARTERPLGTGARAEIVEDGRSGVTVTLDDGAGGVFELVLLEPPPGRTGTEYVSPDGRVHVRIDDD